MWVELLNQKSNRRGREEESFEEKSQVRTKTPKRKRKEKVAPHNVGHLMTSIVATGVRIDFPQKVSLHPLLEKHQY